MWTADVTGRWWYGLLYWFYYFLHFNLSEIITFASYLTVTPAWPVTSESGPLPLDYSTRYYTGLWHIFLKVKLSWYELRILNNRTMRTRAWPDGALVCRGGWPVDKQYNNKKVIWLLRHAIGTTPLTKHIYGHSSQWSSHCSSVLYCTVLWSSHCSSAARVSQFWHHCTT